MGIVPGVVLYRKMDKVFRLVLLFAILSLLCDYLGWVITSLFGTNLWLGNFYYLGSFLILIIACKNIMELKYRKLIDYTILIVSIIWLANVMNFGINHYLTWSFLVIDIVVIISYLYILLTAVITAEKIVQSPLFWLSLPIILFFGCNIPLLGYYNYLIEHDLLLLGKLYNIMIILNYICFPLFGIAFYLQGRKALNTKPDNVY
jgi:hypothetical protein